MPHMLQVAWYYCCQHVAQQQPGLTRTHGCLLSWAAHQSGADHMLLQRPATEHECMCRSSHGLGMVAGHKQGPGMQQKDAAKKLSGVK